MTMKIQRLLTAVQSVNAAKIREKTLNKSLNTSHRTSDNHRILDTHRTITGYRTLTGQSPETGCDQRFSCSGCSFLQAQKI